MNVYPSPSRMDTKTHYLCLENMKKNDCLIAVAVVRHHSYVYRSSAISN